MDEAAKRYANPLPLRALFSLSRCANYALLSPFPSRNSRPRLRNPVYAALSETPSPSSHVPPAKSQSIRMPHSVPPPPARALFFAKERTTWLTPALSAPVARHPNRQHPDLGPQRRRQLLPRLRDLLRLGGPRLRVPAHPSARPQRRRTPALGRPDGVPAL